MCRSRFFVLWLSAGFGVATAQNTGTIRGMVTDPAAASVPPASITIKNVATGLTQTVKMGHAMRNAGSVPAGGRGSPPQGEPLDVKPLPPERTEPIACMVDRMRKQQPPDGQSAFDLHVGVQEVLEAAKMSVKAGGAGPLPLKK